MPAGSAQLAKRALVTLLLILARKYDIPAVVVNRDSPDGVVLATFKKVSVAVCRSLGTHLRKVHRANPTTYKKHKEMQI